MKNMHDTIIDNAARQQALDPTKSFIVQAPAGSGKTELLTRRFLTLLSVVKQPEEIVAITFTRKAAGEMRSRILANLATANYATLPLAQAILTNPNRLRIQTIDGLCASISKQMPILSHFGHLPEILADPEFAYQQAAQHLLQDLETDQAWSDAIATLLIHLDNRQMDIVTLIANLLARREQWLGHLLETKHSQQAKTILEKSLQNIILERLQQLNKFLDNDLKQELTQLAQFAAEQLQLNNKPNPLSNFLALSKSLGYTLAEFAHWQSLANLILTQKGEVRSRLTINEGFPPANKSQKEAMQKLLQHFAEHDKLHRAWQQIQTAPPANYSAAQWQILSALVTVLPIACAYLKLVFRDLNKVDYSEITLAAITALGETDAPTDLALRYEHRIQHLLIDEFQDTSALHYRLIERLIAGWQPDDGHSLFIVGDPMQSIYRFREAEVGLFLRARQSGIGQLPLIPLTLQVNFRSQPEVVNWINQHFSIAFPDFEDIGAGAVPYAMAKAIQQSTANGKIQFAWHNNSTTMNQDFITTLINVRNTNPTDTIAILVSARSHLKAILPLLQKNQLPYQAIEIEDLYFRPIIQDLLSLTKALLHPADRIAWLSILRAPWCGLTLADLTLITAVNSHLTVWEQLLQNYRHPNLSEHAKRRLPYFIQVIHLCLQTRNQQALSDWVEGAWLALGGPACLQDNNQLVDVNTFWQILTNLALAGDIPDPLLLEQHLQQYYASVSSTEKNPIQIMTIHKAKGLEFDIVFIPELQKEKPIKKQQLLLWMERPSQFGTNDLLLAPIKSTQEDNDPCYHFLRKEDDRKESYELGRLLYVAVTRAKHSLYMYALQKTEKTTYTPSNRSLLRHLWHHAQTIPCTATTNIQQELTPISMQHNSIQRLPSTWQSPFILPAPKAPPLTITSYALTTIDKQNTLVGTLIHQSLQTIANEGIQTWTLQKIAAQQRIWEMQLINYGIDRQQLPLLIQRIRLALTNVIQDPKAHWILQNHHAMQSEFALSHYQQGKLQKIIIDRTFIANDQRWIIDFKTTNPAPNENIDKFLAEQLNIYRPQLHLYAKIMRTIEQRPIKLGLYFPLLPHWLEWEYEYEYA